MYPALLSGTRLLRQSTRCGVWKACPSLRPAMMLFRAQVGGSEAAGVQAAEPAWLCPGLRSVLPPQLALTPHSSARRPALAGSPAWKGLRRRREKEFGMECGGTLKVAAAAAVSFPLQRRGHAPLRGRCQLRDRCQQHSC